VCVYWLAARVSFSVYKKKLRRMILIN